LKAVCAFSAHGCGRDLFAFSLTLTLSCWERGPQRDACNRSMPRACNAESVSSPLERYNPYRVNDLYTETQGGPSRNRANPGLNDAIPSGLKMVLFALARQVTPLKRGVNERGSSSAIAYMVSMYDGESVSSSLERYNPYRVNDLYTETQGRPSRNRANPGLNDAIPSGLKMVSSVLARRITPLKRGVNERVR
jgi:hypothetical protein